MTTIARLVHLLLIDHIRSLVRRKQEVEKSATVDVTVSIYPSAYAKSRILERIFIIFGNGESYNRCRRIAVLIMRASWSKLLKYLWEMKRFVHKKDKHEVVPVHAEEA